MLVSGGIPIWVGEEGDEDHAAVRALTERITAGLDALVPGLDDPLDAWALERAAAVAERTSDHEPDLADRRSLARQLARAPEPLRAEVVQAAGSYSLALDVADVDDAAVVGSDAPSVTELVVRAVVTWFVAPLIATIAVVNGPAVGAVVLVDRFVSTPVSKGTTRALVAVVLFPATWITVAVLGTDGAPAHHRPRDRQRHRAPRRALAGRGRRRRSPTVVAPLPGPGGVSPAARSAHPAGRPRRDRPRRPAGQGPISSGFLRSTNDMSPNSAANSSPGPSNSSLDSPLRASASLVK